MKTFFQGCLGSFFGVLLALGVTLFAMIALVAGLIAMVHDKQLEPESALLSPGTVLHIRLDHPVLDRESDNLWDQMDVLQMKAVHSMSLGRVLEAIERAGGDDNISGILLEPDLSWSNISDVEALREALLDFQANSGKWIVSYQENYDQLQYYLSSIADEIYLNPMGRLEFKGLAMESTFFKQGLDKFHLDIQVVRGSNNHYKSAVEPFTHDAMSDENRAQAAQLLKSLWAHMLKGIGECRELKPEDLQRLAGELKINLPEDAIQERLADGLFYKDQLLTHLQKKLELDENEPVPFIELGKYAIQEKKSLFPAKVTTGKKKIAVVYALGMLIDGQGDEDYVGSYELCESLRKAREDSDTAAIVLRVNSPGGSAQAAEVVWREVQLAREHKPVVVSMGEIAASGGYYIACAAHKIYAQPSTLTGSIGVFGILPVVDRFFKDNIGITFDHVATNEHALYPSVTHKLTPFEWTVLQKDVDRIYDTFKSRVAQGRSLKPERVEDIAQGRIWSGLDAKDVGLIDEYGGLDEALAEASSQANLKDYEIEEWPKRKNPVVELFDSFQEYDSAAALESACPGLSLPVKTLEHLRTMRGVQAWLPGTIKIH